MLNKTILGLVVSSATLQSPLIANTNAQFLSIQKSSFKKFFTSVYYSQIISSTSFLSVRFQEFLNSAITIENYVNYTVYQDQNFYQYSLSIGTAETKFQNVYWEQSSGAPAISSKSDIILNNVTFVQCKSPQNGGALFMETVLDLNMVEVNFTSCYAEQLAGAFYFNGKNLKMKSIYIDTCTSNKPDNRTSVFIVARSVIAQYMEIDKYSNELHYYTNYSYKIGGNYLNISNSIISVQLLLEIDELNATNVDFNTQKAPSIRGLRMSTMRLSNCFIDRAYNISLLWEQAITGFWYGKDYADQYIPPISGQILGHVDNRVLPNRSPAPTIYSPNPLIQSGQLTPGLIAIIVVCCLIGVFALLGAVWFCISRTSCNFDGGDDVNRVDFE